MSPHPAAAVLPSTIAKVVPLPSADRGVTEQVYDALLKGIESREYGPGRLLDERGLSDALSVSRTPLRNALSRLLGEGYLERSPSGSLAVREIGPTEVLDLLFVRGQLEPEAAAQAAGRVAVEACLALRERLARIDPADEAPLAWQLGDRVHDLVLEHCSNRSLARILIDARRRIRMSALEGIPGRCETARAEHLTILDALVRADAAKARAAMGDHLERSRESFLDALGVGR